MFKEFTTDEVNLFITKPDTVLALLNNLVKTVNHLEQELKKLAQRNHLLEDSKSLNSSNSSMPPSADGFKRQHKTKSLRKKTNRKQERTNRGKIAIDNFGVLPLFNGTAVHDHLRAYKEYNYMHAFCNAHHLRELTFSYERYQQKWVLDMIKLLTKIKRTVDKAALKNQDKLDKFTIRKFEQQYEKLIKQGLEEVTEIENKIKQSPRPGPRKQSKPKNLLDRLNTFKNEVLRFMRDFKIPFDNNQAERDLRMIKLQQKISGSFRNTTGPEYFTNIRSYISTANKQKLNIRNVLQQAFDGNPFIPQVTAK